MRSNNNGPTLVTHKIKHGTAAARSLKYSALLLWNCLPKWLRQESSHEAFNKKLKKVLFQLAFNILLTYLSTLNKPQVSISKVHEKTIQVSMVPHSAILN